MNVARFSAAAVIRGECAPPGSKSLTNRALIASALARGRSTIRNASLSEDSSLLAGALHKLGIPVRIDPSARTMTVDATPPLGIVDRATFNLANAGTAVRFLTAFLTLFRGKFVVDGNARMRRRPIRPLLDALNKLGGKTRTVLRTDAPPVAIESSSLRGGHVRLQAHISSQFLSSLLLIGPGTSEGVQIDVEGPVTSRPYVEMTVEVLRRFGGKPECTDTRWVSPSGGLVPTDWAAEPDAASANYLFAAAAITGGRVRVPGLGTSSIQGEREFLRVLREMGAVVREGLDWTEVEGGSLRGIAADMNRMTDSAQTLAVMALFARGATRITKVANLRLKETDRLAALAMELGRLGARVEPLDDGLIIHPPKKLRPAVVRTYGDHRMAMSFSLAALREPGIVVEDPDCVRKSFPEFFETLGLLGAPVVLDVTR